MRTVFVATLKILALAVWLWQPTEPPPAAPAADPVARPAITPESIPTPAERCDFSQVSTPDEVRRFVDSLKEANQKNLRLWSMGKHDEREEPLAVVAEPAVATPEEAARSGKLVVLVIGGGHVDAAAGTEAALALLRDFSSPTPAQADVLKNVVLVVVPRVYAEPNATTADLDRDCTNLSQDETRRLVRAINKWDPALVIDTRAGDGSQYRYPLVYGAGRHPSGDRALHEFLWQTMLPAVAANMQEKEGLEAFFAGQFSADRSAWGTPPKWAAFATAYMSLRNRLSIAAETPASAGLKAQTAAQRAFAGQCLEWAAGKRSQIKELITNADSAAIRVGQDPTEKDLVGLGANRKPLPGKVTVLGWQEKDEGGVKVRTDTTATYEVVHLAKWTAGATVSRSFAYVLPPDATQTVATLRRHGVAVAELRETIEADAEVYAVDDVAPSDGALPDGPARPAAVSARTVNVVLEPGSFVVRTGQRLGMLAGVLLEPTADGGLTLEAVRVGADWPAMRIVSNTPLLTIGLSPLPEDRAPPRPLTFEDLSAGSPPNLGGSPAGGQEWLADGANFRQSRDGKTRTIRAVTGRAEAPWNSHAAIKALAALPTIGEKNATAVVGRARWNEARTAFFAEHENDLYYAKADGSAAIRLTASPAAEEQPQFSPDGKFVAFVRGFDMWVTDTTAGVERALTTGGSELLRRGVPDWLYMEEIFGRGRGVFWWSPDSSRLAYLEVDGAAVAKYRIVNNAQFKQRVEETAYPKPGEPNPRAKVFTVSAAGGDPAEIDLSGYDVDNMLVTRIVWRPDSGSLVVCVTNRVQTWLDVLAAPAGGGKTRTLFRETTGAWVDESPALTFMKNGDLLFASERTGWKHLYRYDKDGKLIGPVTSGQWDFRALQRLDTDERTVFFTGTRDNPIGENLYRVALDGSEPVRLTDEPGSHRVTVAPQGDLFIDSWSSRTTTTQVVLRSLTDGSVVRMLDTNPVRDLEKFSLGATEYAQITTPDGFALESTLVKPPDFDPNKKYPVWFMTYGGPHSPTISDTWSGGGPGRNWDHALASAGFLVFRADPRSASGKGAASAWTCYKRLGVGELADIEVAIKWLTANPWVDATRVGMAGHSYGGFMTAYAMTHSKLFAGGIAGAPVTDWREYDSIYTERYMLTPQDNPDGYKITSVIEAAKDLHGRLLLAHGMLDNNVHLQNNTRLIKALQDANKPFEMMLYPESRHGLGGRHYQQLQIDFILRTLGDPNRVPSAGDGPSDQGPPRRGRGRRDPSGPPPAKSSANNNTDSRQWLRPCNPFDSYSFHSAQPTGP